MFFSYLSGAMRCFWVQLLDWWCIGFAWDKQDEDRAGVTSSGLALWHGGAWRLGRALGLFRRMHRLAHSHLVASCQVLHDACWQSVTRNNTKMHCYVRIDVQCVELSFTALCRFYWNVEKSSWFEVFDMQLYRSPAKQELQTQDSPMADSRLLSYRF